MPDPGVPSPATPGTPGSPASFPEPSNPGAREPHAPVPGTPDRQARVPGTPDRQASVAGTPEPQAPFPGPPIREGSPAASGAAAAVPTPPPSGAPVVHSSGGAPALAVAAPVERLEGRLAQLRREGRGALVAYGVAGYPDLDGSLAAFRAMAEAGADVLEVGPPYSDPLIDGPVIQRAVTAAL